MNNHVRWVPRHHGMSCPQVADRGDSLQIWKAVANILNKQSRPADRGGPPAWRLGVGLTTTRNKKNKLVMKCHKRPRAWTDSINKRSKIGKMNMRFGMWDVRSLYRAGSLMTVAKELVGVQVVRWDGGDT
jgi:hypothetical protein